jgi:hypothetical protein
VTHRFKASRLTSPRIKSLGTFSGLKVYLVDGESIRNTTEIDFTMGGTRARWKFIPDGEIWIDECHTDLDKRATIRHEAKEYYEMKDKGLTYLQAHEKANVVERKYRREAIRG